MNSDAAKSDLAYIRQIMAETRQVTYLSGEYFVVWGLVIGLGVLGTWGQVVGYWAMSPFLIWSLAYVLGIVVTLFLVRQECRKPVEAPAGKLVGMLWASLGVSMMINFFVGVGSGALDGQHMSGIASSLVGAAVFLTGALSGIIWLRNLAAGWWVGAAVMFIWPGEHVFLLMGFMLLALHVVPGIILIRIRHKTEA